MVIFASSNNFIELLVALILRHLGLDVVGDAPLEGGVNQSIIVPCSVHVQVEEVIDVLYVSARHLHHWQANYLVVCRGKPLSVYVLQISLLYL